MEDLSLLLALHRSQARQGPGSDAHTLRAATLAGLPERRGLRIADVGCGTGASTLALAEALDAQIVAVDLFSEFLEGLQARAAARGLAGRILPVQGAMERLPFAEGSLDVIWSEGAIYHLGFEAGLAAWRPLLRAGGVLAVSELTWLTTRRPPELEAHWAAEYPEVGTAAEKFAALERQGFTPVGYFPLPEACWLEGYYRPLAARFPAFLATHEGAEGAAACVAEAQREIALYERHRAHLSYGFYVARTDSTGMA